MSQRLKQRLYKRMRKLIHGKGVPYMKKLVSVPHPGKGTYTPWGGPPYKRSGRLLEKVYGKCWPMPGAHGRIIAFIESLAISKSSSERYPYILESGFYSSWGMRQVGPFPFMKPTFEYLQRVGKEMIRGFLDQAEFHRFMCTGGEHPGALRKKWRKIVL